MPSRIRVLFGGIAHESNTFCPQLTSRSDFEAHGWYRREEIAQLAGTNTVGGGVLEAAAGRQDVELVLSMVTSATPGGPVADDVLAMALSELIASIRSRPPDAVVLDLHGAMVSESEDDADGALLRALREEVGPSVPIVTVLDLHANVGPLMLEHATMLIPYDTYPHVDMAERGREALDHAVRAAKGEIVPTMVGLKVPMLPPVPRQCSAVEPTRTILDHVHAIERLPGILSAGVAYAFPYADCPFAGMTVLVTSDGAPDLAQAHASQLRDDIWSRREEFLPDVKTVDEAVRFAASAPSGPIVLADLGDNPGGGSAGDGTAMLWALLDMGITDAVVAVLADPDVASIAHLHGVGATIEVDLGGKTDDLHGFPIPVRATIEHVSDGTFVHEGPMLRGMPGSMGATAVLRCEGRHGGSVRVIVAERRTQALDTGMLRSQGIEPESARVIALKSAVHFRAAFGPLAAEIIEVDTPGLTSVDFRRFPYQRLRRPIFPLDAITSPVA